MTPEISTYDVEFTGARSGVSALTWGQRWMWDEADAVAPQHAHLNLQMIVDVPEHTTSDVVVSALRSLLLRRESLRTSYRLSPTGEPEQVLVARGELRTEVRRTSPEAARRAAYLLAQDLQRVPFGVAELPVRAGVVVAGGVPRHLVLVVFHMATDGWDMVALRAELRDLLAHTDSVPDQPAIHRRQPMEQAEREQGPEGRRVSERSVQHWKKQLNRQPPGAFSTGGFAPETPRFTDVCMLSQSLGIALPALAARLKASQTTIYLAMIAALLGRSAGSESIGFTITCRNRYAPGDQAATGTFVQDVPVVVDLATHSFREIVRRTWGSLIPAYAASAGDPAQVRAVLEEAGRILPSGNPKLTCTVNVEIDIGAGEVSVVEQLTRAGQGGTFDSTARFFRTAGRDHDRPGRTFYLAANAYAGHVFTKIVADTTVLPTQHVVDFLTNLEQLAVLALAEDEVDPLLVPLPRRWDVASSRTASPEPRVAALNQVVYNDAEQYFIWPSDQELPDGWFPEGTTGTEEACMAHLAYVIGMRPVDVRRVPTHGTPVESPCS